MVGDPSRTTNPLLKWAEHKPEIALLLRVCALQFPKLKYLTSYKCEINSKGDFGLGGKILKGDFLEWGNDHFFQWSCQFTCPHLSLGAQTWFCFSFYLLYMKRFLYGLNQHCW